MAIGLGDAASQTAEFLYAMTCLHGLKHSGLLHQIGAACSQVASIHKLKLLFGILILPTAKLKFSILTGSSVVEH